MPPCLASNSNVLRAVALAQVSAESWHVYERVRSSCDRKKPMGTRLYVGNLSFQTTEATLMAAFTRIGAVSELHIVTDHDKARSRGFGFVLMADAASAKRAIAQLDGAIVDGRALRVNEAEDRPQPSSGQSHSAFGNRGKSG